MAGIWNRIHDRGENDAPVSSLALWSAVYLVGRGVFTAAQARNALNSDLPADKQLTAAEESDLNAILTASQAGTATARLDYMLRLQALMLLAETGTLDSESAFRTQLGI